MKYIFLLAGLAACLAAPRALGSESAASAPARSSVTERPVAQIKAASEAIDRYLHASRQASGVKPGRRISDEVFVRRIYIEIAGRIPTYTETEAFLSNTHPQRRSQLIDQLLDSDAYVHNAYIFWANILRVKSRVEGGIPQGGLPYVTWLKDALRENRPYDQMVHELIAAEGALWEQGNGAVGYYFRDRGMPLDNMANTMRVFLGTRIECAQCHNHPFDVWTQRDFYEMAAFTDGQGNLMQPRFQNLQKELQRAGNNTQLSEELRRFSRPLFQLVGAGLSSTGNGSIGLPEDYQYADGKPGERVMATPLFGALPAHVTVAPAQAKPEDARKHKWAKNRQSKGTHSREALAAWMIAPENERFTTVIVNRLWKLAFGRALIEPLDDLREGVQASHPELLAHLEVMMKQLDYDMKQFLRVVYNTQSYQSEVVSRDLSPSERFDFEGPLFERMTAEQMWDSLLTLTVPEVDKRTHRDEGASIQYIYNKYKDYSAPQFIDEVKRLAGSSGEDPMRRNDLLRALRQVFEREKGMPEDFISQLTKEKNALQMQISDAYTRRSLAEASRLKRVLATKGLDNHTVFNRDYVRASEAGSPAPNGHFIREFGGSDREQVENAHDQPGVPQILSLLNGYVDNHLLANNRSVLWRAVEDAPTNNERVDILYKSLLSREPTRDEMAAATRDLRARGHDALEDLLWVLVNSREFMFIL